MRPITLFVAMSLVAILLTACDTTPIPTPKDQRCLWEPGPCKMLVEGYRFDRTTADCVAYRGGGCTSTPFSNLTECQAICQ